MEADSMRSIVDLKQKAREKTQTPIHAKKRTRKNKAQEKAQ